jgi:hypothetical protein
MASELWVLNMCDTEPDKGVFRGVRPIKQGSKQRLWRGVTEALPKFIEQCDSIRDDCGLPMKMTLFIRSDFQIAEFYGRPGWALYNFRSLWDNFMEKGHEIGWHPHLWRWSDKRGSWYQEMFDEKWIREECLRPGYEDFSSFLPVKVSRMGWCYHNNCTMRQMDRFGVKADFSGLAKIVDGMRKGLPERNYNMHDWSLTPNYTYHPSEADYRRPARNGERALSILEVPQDTLQLSPLLRIINKIKNIPYKNKPNQFGRKVINMYCYRLLLVRRYIEQHLAHAIQEDKPVLLSWSLHADDLLPDKIRKIVFRNIECLQHMTKGAGVKLRFVTASQVAEYLKN